MITRVREVSSSWVYGQGAVAYATASYTPMCSYTLKKQQFSNSAVPNVTKLHGNLIRVKQLFITV